MTAIITIFSLKEKLKKRLPEVLQIANGRDGHGIYNPWLFCYCSFPILYWKMTSTRTRVKVAQETLPKTSDSYSDPQSATPPLPPWLGPKLRWLQP